MFARRVVSHLSGERDLLEQIALLRAGSLRGDLVAEFSFLVCQQMFGKLLGSFDLLQVQFLMANNAVVLRFADVQRQFAMQCQSSLGPPRFLMRLN